MRVKNHMAIWFLWFLWFLRVECSSNQLYKPLCAFLVFVDLVWFLCGSFCGFWSRVVFWLWSARPIVLMWFLWVGCLALDARCRRLRVRSCSCGFCGSVVLPSMLDADDCASDRAHVVFVGRWSCSRCSMLDARCRRLSVHLLFVDC